MHFFFFFCKFTFILTLLDHVAFHVAILTKRAIIDVTSLPSRMHTRTHSFVEKLSVQIKPAAAAKAAFVRNLMVLCAETKNSSAAVQFEVPGAHTQKTRLPLLRSKQARLSDGGRSFFFIFTYVLLLLLATVEVLWAKETEQIRGIYAFFAKLCDKFMRLERYSLNMFLFAHFYRRFMI